MSEPGRTLSRNPAPEASREPVEYPDINNIFANRKWIPVACFVVALAAVSWIKISDSPILIFSLLYLPMFIIAWVTSRHSKTLRQRLFANWLLSYGLAICVFAITRNNGTFDIFNSTIDAGRLIALTLWALVAYWTALAVQWSINVVKAQDDKIQTLATMVALWGSTIQLAFFAGGNVIDMLDLANSELPSLNLFAQVSLFLSSVSIFKFIPVSAAILALFIIALYNVRKNPVDLTDLDDFPGRNLPPILQIVLSTFKLPLWMLWIGIEYLSYVMRAISSAVLEFARFWLARSLFIFLGIVLPLTALYLGHLALLRLSDLSIYYLSNTGLGVGELTYIFFFGHGFALFAMVLYLASIALMGIEYRGETIWQGAAIQSLYRQIFLEGKTLLQAVGKSFALMTFYPVAIAFTLFFPASGGPGMFSIFYAALLLAALIGTWFWSSSVKPAGSS